MDFDPTPLTRILFYCALCLMLVACERAQTEGRNTAALDPDTIWDSHTFLRMHATRHGIVAPGSSEIVEMTREGRGTAHYWRLEVATASEFHLDAHRTLTSDVDSQLFVYGRESSGRANGLVQSNAECSTRDIDPCLNVSLERGSYYVLVINQDRVSAGEIGLTVECRSGGCRPAPPDAGVDADVDLGVGTCSPASAETRCGSPLDVPVRDLSNPRCPCSYGACDPTVNACASLEPGNGHYNPATQSSWGCCGEPWGHYSIPSATGIDADEMQLSFYPNGHAWGTYTLHYDSSPAVVILSIPPLQAPTTHQVGHAHFCDQGFLNSISSTRASIEHRNCTYNSRTDRCESCVVTTVTYTYDDTGFLTETER